MSPRTVAEREGFEPPIRLPVFRISSAVRLTTLPPLRGRQGREAPCRSPLCIQRHRARQGRRQRARRIGHLVGGLRPGSASRSGRRYAARGFRVTAPAMMAASQDIRSGKAFCLWRRSSCVRRAVLSDSPARLASAAVGQRRRFRSCLGALEVGEMPDLGAGPLGETMLIRLLVRLGAEPHSPVAGSDESERASAEVAFVRSILHAESPSILAVISIKKWRAV
jgi:hypothetical protein